MRARWSLFYVVGVLSPLLMSSLLAPGATGAELGGEKAAFHTIPQVLPTDIRDDDFDDNSTATPYGSNGNITSHRQDLCFRYEMYRRRKILLKDALKGKQLNLLFPNNAGFLYSPETGINPGYGGLGPDIMDELAIRAGFTWRNSFGIVEAASEYNMTWTEQLWWGINTYDMYVNRWDQSLERMQMGIAFLEPWYDASIILIDKREANTEYVDSFTISTFWNWARPFSAPVWILTAVTILFSGLVYQFIEYMNEEQQGRSKSQWFYDNLYLSLLNFTQNFEYAPSTGAGRIFSVSMAFWAMIMTATYTANLAGYMITTRQPAPTIQNILEAVVQGIPICTYANTNSDFMIKERYPTAIRKPKATEWEMYNALHAGECGLLADHVSSWYSKRERKRFNPDCDLEWVGDTVAAIRASFAIKADVGFKCTSLIRDVLNVHLTEFIADGGLAKAWQTYRSRIRDHDCDYVYEDLTQSGAQRHNAHNLDPAHAGTRSLSVTSGLLKQSQNRPQHGHRRRLKSSSSSSSSTESDSEEEERPLTIEEMAGTFMLHYGLMLIAIASSLVAPWWAKWKLKMGWAEPVPITLGLSRLNSYAIRGKTKTGDDTVDLFTDEECAGISQRRRETMSGRDGLFREENPEQSISPPTGVIKEVVEDQLKHFEDRHQKKMDDHIAMVVVMLNDMRKQNKKFHKNVLSELGMPIDDKRLSSSPSACGGSRDPSSSNEFGRYLRSSFSN